MGTVTTDQKPEGVKVRLPSGRIFIPNMKPVRPKESSRLQVWDGISRQWRSVNEVCFHGGAGDNTVLREAFYLEHEGQLELQKGRNGSWLMRWKSPQNTAVPRSADIPATSTFSATDLTDIPEINEAVEEAMLLVAIAAEKAVVRMTGEADNSYDAERVAKLETQVADLQTKLARTNAALQAALSGGE